MNEALKWIAIGVCALLIAWGLSLLIVPLGHAISIILQGFAIACGLVWALATTGAAAGVALSPALAGGAAIGVGAIGVAGAGVLIVRLLREAENRDPFEWVVPVFGIWAGIITNVATQILPPEAIAEKLAYAVIAGASVIAGALLLKRRELVYKCVGALLHLFPPAFIFGALILGQQGVVLYLAFTQNPAIIWSVIVVLAATSALSVVVSLKSAR